MWLPTRLSELGLSEISDHKLLTAINNELKDKKTLVQRLSKKPTPHALLDSIKMADAGKNRRKS